MTPFRIRRMLVAWSTASILAVGLPSVTTADESQRLPGDAIPSFESIHLNLDAAKTDYTGSVRVALRVPKATRSIHFHAQEMKLTRVVLQAKGKSWPLTTKEGVWGMITATATREIPAGSYMLEVEFANEFDRRATSLYRVESGGNAYTFTQFEAIDARAAFPCWDEPEYKIPYQVTLTVPEAHEAVTNTPIATTSTSKGMKTVVFQKTKPLPSYLLAIATGPFEYVPMQGTSIPARIVVPKGSTALAQTAATMTPPLLKALEDYFGRPYPYEKLDLIAVPEFSPGAMENPGAITFGDRYILFDPKTMSVGRRRLYAIFAAHEMAHMWFGDLVTMKWWDDLWLNESFADWMSERIAAQVHPDLGVKEGDLEELNGVMAEDARLSTHAIRQPVTNMDNLFEGIEVTYKKGSAVLAMFERWMGPDVFRTAIRAYLKKYEWRNATADDLWAALSEASGRDVRTPMATFLDQPGIPLVRAELLDNGQVKLTQRRFLGYGVTSPSERWGIPMTVRYSDGTTTKTHSFLLAEPTATIQLPGLTKKAAWIDPNAGGGYYRYSVEAPVLATLSSHGEEILPPADRIRLIHNLSALVLAGEVKGDDYLRTLQGFATDPRPEVVTAVITSLGRVKGAFVTTDLEPAFAAYVRQVLRPAALRFGLERKEGEEEAVSLLRPALLEWLADDGRDETALAHAEQLAKSFRADRGSIDPSLVVPALRLSAIRGNADLFEEYRKRFEEATAPTDRDPLLAAMGSFRDPALRDRALAYTLGPTVRPQEVFTIPRAVAQQDLANQSLVSAWFQQNHKAIMDKIPPVYDPFVVYMSLACEEQPLERAKAFYSTPDHSAPGMDVELAKMLETGNDCVKLRAREGAAVAQYLSQIAQAR